MFQYGYMMFSIGLAIVVAAPINSVAARSCDGGHRCSPPKECCAQGCCYLYAPPSAPRTPSPNTSHVLNLFFINHWFFWCTIFAIIIAILCACSLWKKRRQICGWGSPRPHSQSGDSAGSCYAPPQYSRCSSFINHHAPPPYTEVTTKPDLYPLVFTCNNSDNGKNGASYLMVQYFRNYIVRPVGSLSATSTVDSLSSSFICNANEANTLIPPPYSRAGSPNLPINIEDYASMPRSASQQACSIEQLQTQRPIPVLMSNMHHHHNNMDDEQITLYQHADFVSDDGNMIIDEAGTTANGDQYRRTPHSVSFQRLHNSTNGTNDPTNNPTTILNSNLVHNKSSGNHNNNNNNNNNNNLNSFSKSTKNNTHNNNSNNYKNNFIDSHPMTDDHATRLQQSESQSDQSIGTNDENNSNISCDVIAYAQQQQQQQQYESKQLNTAPMMLANTCSTQESSNGTNAKRNNNNEMQNGLTYSNSTNGIYNSYDSVADARENRYSLHLPSTMMMMSTPTEKSNGDFKDLSALRKNFEKFYPIGGVSSNDTQAKRDSMPKGLPLSEESPINDVLKKYGMNMRSYNDSINSTVSSLANIDTPPSPPQATSPTGEIRELLEKIRQLQQNASSPDDYCGNIQSGAATTISNESSSLNDGVDAYDGDESSSSTGVIKKIQEQQQQPLQTNKRPSSLQQNRRSQQRTRFFPANLRSPSGAGILGFSRGRKAWISKSAPTTPGTAMPSCFLDDDSPLLNEHDEDAEQNS